MIHLTTGKPGEGMTYVCTPPTHENEAVKILAVPAVSESGACTPRCLICGQTGEQMHETHRGAMCPIEHERVECIDCGWSGQRVELAACVDLAVDDDEKGCPICGGLCFPDVDL